MAECRSHLLLKRLKSIKSRPFTIYIGRVKYCGMDILNLLLPDVCQQPGDGRRAGRPQITATIGYIEPYKWRSLHHIAGHANLICLVNRSSIRMNIRVSDKFFVTKLVWQFCSSFCSQSKSGTFINVCCILILQNTC